MISFIPKYILNYCFMCSTASCYNLYIPLASTKRTFVDLSTNLYLKKEMYRISRNSMILPQHVGHVFLVHNGKTYMSVHVSHKMLGHKFGEFASTRKQPQHKKKNKKKL